MDDGRKGHHSQRDVRDVIEETPQEAVLDTTSDQDDGQDANQIGHHNHDGQIDVDVLAHEAEVD